MKMIYTMKQIYYLIVLFLTMHISVAQATILSSSVESLQPVLPKVGETLVIRIAITEDFSLRALKHDYSYTNTNTVEFIHIQRRIVQRKQYIEVSLRIKKSGTIHLPVIYENNYKIPLPVVTVVSSIEDTSSYTSFLAGKPVGIIVYGIVSIIVFVYAIVLLIRIVWNMSFLLKRWGIHIRNYISHLYSVYETKKMLKILNRIGSPKMRVTCTTKELYRTLDTILRKRLQFLLGVSYANSMTYAEIESLLLDKLQITEQYFISQLHDFFFVMYEAEYGTLHYPLEVRKRHCQFLLQLLEKCKKFSYEIRSKHSFIAQSLSTNMCIECTR